MNDRITREDVDRLDALDHMYEAEEYTQRIEDMQQRLTVLAQLLTCAIANLGGEMAVTTTEIERAVSGQQLALTSLPNNRGFYVALVTHSPGDHDVATPAAPAAPVDPRRFPDPRT